MHLYSPLPFCIKGTYTEWMARQFSAFCRWRRLSQRRVNGCVKRAGMVAITRDSSRHGTLAC